MSKWGGGSAYCRTLAGLTPGAKATLGRCVKVTRRRDDRDAVQEGLAAMTPCVNERRMESDASQQEACERYADAADAAREAYLAYHDALRRIEATYRVTICHAEYDAWQEITLRHD